MKTKLGFTLIELLVVVLIIGILAAIAVPQYQSAVLKSKYTQAITLADAIMKDQQYYFIANGKYASSFTDLNVMPPQRSISTDTHYYYDWGYCQLACIYNTTGANCGGCVITSKNRALKYWYEPWNQVRICSATASWEDGNKVCKNQTGLTQPTSVDSWGTARYIYKN